MSTGRVLMVQGTSSSVGKSLLVAALCRIFARRGLRVAPFKAQNMSNNAAVCADGAEIGRAQALQALAAGVTPSADMNPVLLKPEADSRSQVVVLGKMWRTLPARSYYERKQFLWSHVTAALDRLRSAYELVVIEGAGSPVELNLKAGDIVNMAVARYANAPVLLVGDIDRGGVFAQLLGTLALLPTAERALVRGLIVNKFRGDPTLFTDGIRILEERGGVPVLGVVPFLHDLGLPDEDAVPIEGRSQSPAKARVDVAVVRLPRIANFDDLDPLRLEPDVRLRYVDSPSHLGQPDAVILPGTKSTVADLQWLRDRGLAAAISRLADGGTAVAGICGGYQMLGRSICDPDGVESESREVPGLGLLPVETTFAPQKATHQVRARIAGKTGWMAGLTETVVTGYEIHVGETRTDSPWLEILERGGEPYCVADGAVSPSGRVWGCYLHGLFANDEFRRAWLASLRPDFRAARSSAAADVQAGLERLANTVAEAIPVAQLEQILHEGGAPMSEENADQHREKMARRKEAHDRKLAAATREKGLLIVNTGAGKGKTTASLGMVFRALGHGMKVGVVQFTKGAIPTGEAALAKKLAPLLEWHTLGEGFTWDTQDRERDVAAARKAWETAVRLLRDPTFDLVVLDELNIVLRYDYLALEDVMAELRAKREMLHVVVTGRNAKAELIEAADLVTEMNMVKHPFRSGVKPQRGVEF